MHVQISHKVEYIYNIYIYYTRINNTSIIYQVVMYNIIYTK